jgi:predicted negative regulator of RcsB-dependent stress response
MSGQIIAVIGVVLGVLLGLFSRIIERRFFSRSIGEDDVFKLYQDKYYSFLDEFRTMHSDMMEMIVKLVTVQVASMMFDHPDLKDEFPQYIRESAERYMDHIRAVRAGEIDQSENELVQDMSRRYIDNRDKFRALKLRHEVYFSERVAKELAKYGDRLDAVIDRDDPEVLPMKMANVESQHRQVDDAILRELAAVNAKKKKVSDLIQRK